MKHDPVIPGPRRPESPPPGSVDGQVWNLFRHKNETDLWCAVPTSYSVPAFLFSGEWGFGGRLASNDPACPDLTLSSCRMAVQLNGFYLFVRFSSGPESTRVVS